MPIVINTNLNSITAQRSLETVNRQLTQSIQRLSSGLRINSARDDASGLVIATRLTSQIRGLNAAVRNLSDGISLVQTAEGGISSITSNLQRIRELAVQSANITLTETERAALQSEVTLAREEITRVAQQTTFNGRVLLNGGLGPGNFVAGANITTCCRSRASRIYAPPRSALTKRRVCRPRPWVRALAVCRASHAPTCRCCQPAPAPRKASPCSVRRTL